MPKFNILQSGGKKLQQSRWPVWLPYPTCWLKSLIISVFLRYIIYVAEMIVKTGYRLAYVVNSSELFVLFTIIIIISPIILIAFTHHYLHLVLSRFIPQIKAPELGKTKGLVPQLMSWWEGLYGWLVIVLSTLNSTMICSLFFPFFNLSYLKLVEEYTQFQQNIIVIFGIIWLIQAALIYQVEYLVRHRLVSVYSQDKSSS